MRRSSTGFVEDKGAKRSYVVKVNGKGRQTLQQAMTNARLCVSSIEERIPVLWPGT